MKSIQAGIIKDLLNTIKKISEGLFNYLGSSDLEKSNTEIDEKNVKKKSESVYILKGKYKGGAAPLPYSVTVTLPTGMTMKDAKKQNTTIPRIEVEANLSDETVRGYKTDVPTNRMWEIAEKLLLSLLDDDTKQAFGIKASKAMKVTLQRVVGAKETSIYLSEIKASYDIKAAYKDLDTVLNNPRFIRAVTEEPVSFVIEDMGDSFDVRKFK
jgi:hypothetical protein